MRRFIALVGSIGLCGSVIASCSDRDLIVAPRSGALEPSGGTGNTGRAGSSGAAGSAGSSTGGSGTGGGGAGAAGAGGAGSGGEAGAGSVAADAGSDAGAGEPDASGPVPPIGAGDAGATSACGSSSECDDANDCTTEACVDGVCVVTPAAIGTACGDTASESECNLPDTCDGAGVCLPNTQPDGALCESGHCNTEGTCDCAVERITALPYAQQWQTTGDSEADFHDACQLCAGTLDHVVVFTAPAAGTYRFTAASGGDAELAVYDGDCSGALDNPTCGSDVDAPNEDYADLLELALEAGAIVTVVVGESCEENGGAGNLAIELVADDG